MQKGMSMWPTSRSRAPRLQLHRPVLMCTSCRSLRSPYPWLSSRVAQVSEPVSLKVCTAGMWALGACSVGSQGLLGCTSGWAVLEGVQTVFWT